MQQEAENINIHRRFPTAVILVLLASLQILIVGIAFLGGYLFNDYQSGEPLPFTGSRFPILSEAFKLLEENAFYQLPGGKKLEYGMIKGMLQAYNEPFTVFVEPPQHELQSQQLEGKYGGIGVRIERDAQNYVYLYPVTDSPAAKAGVRDGDRLIKVNNLVIFPEIKDDDIQAAIRGPVGQIVKITIGHSPEYAPIELSITRAEVALPSTSWNLVPNTPGVGIIHVHIIAETTPDEVAKAIQDLQKQGAARFILDVRNNGGGLVDAGVDMARLFLKSGTVIDEQYKGQAVKSYKVTSPGKFSDLPITILVNHGTASAAEIFAGALQGQKRAQIVGTRTFGKDTIQLVFNLSDGSSLHVTSAHWWVPDMPGGISGKGLQPDVVVGDNANDSQILQKAIQALPN
jgi:carboxyl-terminal processing protease